MSKVEPLFTYLRVTYIHTCVCHETSDAFCSFFYQSFCLLSFKFKKILYIRNINHLCIVLKLFSLFIVCTLALLMVLYAKVWKIFDVFEIGIFSFLRLGSESDRTSSHIFMFPSCVTNQSWWVLCWSHREARFRSNRFIAEKSRFYSWGSWMRREGESPNLSPQIKIWSKFKEQGEEELCILINSNSRDLNR